MIIYQFITPLFHISFSYPSFRAALSVLAAVDTEFVILACAEKYGEEFLKSWHTGGTLGGMVRDFVNTQAQECSFSPLIFSFLVIQCVRAEEY